MPKCKFCKEKFEPSDKSIKQYCSFDHLISHLRQQKAKTMEKKVKEDIKEKKQKLKTYSQKLNEAKKVFQKWIRQRDEQQHCISCGVAFSNPCWDAGHFKKAELFRGVIFNEDNVHKQCRKCNFYMDGNELEYRRGLINRIGLCRVVSLEELAEETKKYKYSDEELEQIKKTYKTKQ